MKIIFLSHILFQTLKQQSYYKSLITKTDGIDGNTFKMKAANPVQVIKNKKHCFWFCLDRTYTLVLTTRFFACPIGRASKMARPKTLNLSLKRDLSTTAKALSGLCFTIFRLPRTGFTKVVYLFSCSHSISVTFEIFTGNYLQSRAYLVVFMAYVLQVQFVNDFLDIRRSDAGPGGVL